MLVDCPPVTEVEIVECKGRTLVRLAWHAAERWQEWFRNHHVESILCLDPMSHEAYLEPTPGLTADHLRKILATLPVTAS